MRLFLIGSIGIVLSVVVGPIQIMASNPVSIFNEIHGIASLLESAGMLVVDKPSQDLIDRRELLLYSFIKEPKSEICQHFYDRAVQMSTDFKNKALAAIEEQKKSSGNWFNKMFTNPMNNLKNWAKSDRQLTDIAQRYREQIETLVDNDVDCDMHRYQIRRLHPILFVLKTDIKYLLKERREIVNKAIFDRLHQDQFTSRNNFYDETELTPRQKELVLDYYASITDTGSTTLAETINSIFNPGEYRIGRLLDSCHSVQSHHGILIKLENDYDHVCGSSKSDPRGKFFKKQFPSNSFEDIAKFCEEFLEAL